MFFSIIIPVYNNEEILVNAVTSVALQEIDRAFEIIIVDDGSSDGSFAIAKTLAKEYSNIVVYRKNNGGASSARNFGLEKSKGDWILFLDSDDIMAANSLYHRANAIKANPNCDLFCGKQLTYDESGPPYNIIEKNNIWAYLLGEECRKNEFTLINEPVANLIISTVVIHTNTVMFSKKLLQKTGCFDTSLHRGEDQDLWLRFAINVNHLCYINQNLASYILRKGSLSREKEPDAIYIIKFIEKLRKNINFKEFYPQLNIRLENAYIVAVWHYRQEGKFREAFRIVKKYLKMSPLSMKPWKLLISVILRKH